MSPGDKKGVVLVKVDRAYGSLINNRAQGGKVARRSEDVTVRSPALISPLEPGPTCPVRVAQCMLRACVGLCESVEDCRAGWGWWGQHEAGLPGGGAPGSSVVLALAGEGVHPGWKEPPLGWGGRSAKGR